jgi:hypothetical protein
MSSRSRARWAAALLAVLALAAGCTGEDEPEPRASGSSSTQPPAAQVGAGWDVVVMGAHTESQLPGPAGSFRPNAGQRFLVVDLVVTPPERGDAFAASEAALLTADGERMEARGGGADGRFCVGCDFRAPAGRGDVSASVVFLVEESASLDGMRLQVGNLEPVDLVVTAGDDTSEVRGADMALLGSSPATRPTITSDMAFWGDLAVVGSYDGFRLIDISDPEHPTTVGEAVCRARQGDVSIYEDLVFLSNDTPTTTEGCDGLDTTAGDPGAFEGIRIFDVSDPSNPTLVKSVRTDCGSHTHTLLPQPDEGRVLLYVSSYAPTELSVGPDCQPPHGHVSVVSVPLADPTAARVVAEPDLVDTRTYQWGGIPEFIPGTGCHDITVVPSLAIAAAACMSEGQLWDISDPLHPRVTAHIRNPDVIFWHGSSFSPDGRFVAFGDEDLFGTDGCRSEATGQLWVYRVADTSEPVSHYTIPRPQELVLEEDFCSAHNFVTVPWSGSWIVVAAFYIGGTSVIDLSDPAAPVEATFYDAVNPKGSNVWSAYWYDGHVYASDIGRGLDVISLSLAGLEAAAAQDHLNPQTQDLVGG